MKDRTKLKGGGSTISSGGGVLGLRARDEPQRPPELRCVHCGSEEVVRKGHDYVCLVCATVQPKIEQEDIFGTSFQAPRPPEAGERTEASKVKRGDRKWSPMLQRAAGGEWTRAEVNLWTAKTALKNVLDRLGIPTTGEKGDSQAVTGTMKIYERIYRSKVFSQPPIKKLVFASFIIYSENQGIPRSSKEISLVATIRKKELDRMLNRIYGKFQDYKPKAVSPEDFLLRLSTRIQLPDDEKIALNIESRKLLEHIRRVSPRLPQNKLARGFAASVILVAARKLGMEDISPDDMSQLGLVTSVTLRNRVREIDEVLREHPLG